MGVKLRLGVFENSVLRRIFGSKSDDMTGKWIKLHNKEFCNLCSLPSIIRMMKSRRMRWVGHVARIREKRNMYRLFVEKPDRKTKTYVSG
jgi:hypothetical protein